MKTVAMILALLACAGCSACGSSMAAQTPRVAPPSGELWLTQEQLQSKQIEIAPVQESILDRSVPAYGRVTFDDKRVAHVLSPVVGRVMELNAGIGARVKKGDALATIESPDLGNASSDAGKAKADLVAAKHNFERQKGLYEKHAASQMDYETAEDNYGRALAERERAEQRLRMLHARSGGGTTQRYVLRSPIDGEVMARNINVGMEVQSQYATGGAPELFTIGNIDQVWVVADVYERHLARLTVGATAELRVVAYPDRSFKGRIDWISSMLDPTTRAAKVRCVLSNEDHLLKPEMWAALAVASEGKPAFAIPRSAVIHLGDQPVVFVERGKTEAGLVRVIRHPVTIDDSSASGLVEVKSGLGKGQSVVVAGTQLLAGML